MFRRAMVLLCVVSTAPAYAALAYAAPLSVDEEISGSRPVLLAAAKKTAPAKAPTKTPDQYFSDCRAGVGDERFTGCDRAIASRLLRSKDLVVAYTNRGVEFFAKGDLDKAEADLNEAIRLDATYQWAQISKARLLLAKKDPAAALIPATAAVHINATAYAYAVRGQVLQALGLRDQAISDYTEVLSHNPGYDERLIVQRAYADMGLPPPDAALPRGSASVFSNPETTPKPAPGDDLGPIWNRITGGSGSPFAPAPAINPAPVNPSPVNPAPVNPAPVVDPRIDAQAADNAAAICKGAGSNSDAGIAACGRAIASGKFAGNDLAVLFDKRGHLRKNSGSADLAIADFTEAVKADPKFFDAVMSRADAYMEKRNFAAAIADYTTAIKLTSTPFDVTQKRGAAYVANGNYEEAIADYGALIKVHPDFKELYADRGDAFRLLGRRDEAVADYLKAASLNRGFAGPEPVFKGRVYTALMGLGIDAAAADKDNDTCLLGSRVGVDERIAACGRAIASGRFGGADLAALYAFRRLRYLDKQDDVHALADANEEVKLQPNNASLLTDRCLDYYRNKDYDHALSDCNEAIRLNPKNPDAFANRGYVQTALGRRDEAMADFQQSLTLNPNNIQRQWVEAGYKALGIDLQAADKDSATCRTGPRDDAALLACGRAIASAKFTGRDLAALYDLRVFLYSNKQDYAHAIADLDEEIKLEPNDARHFADRCWSYYFAKDYDHALTDCNEAIRLDPMSARAFAVRGYTQTALGHRDNAIADLDKSLTLNPSDNDKQWALAGLKGLGVDTAMETDAETCRMRAQGNATLAACGRTIASGKFTGHDLAVLYDARANLLRGKGDYAAAIADMNGAVQLEPDNANHLADRCLYYYESKDYPHALSDCNEAIRLDSKNLWAFANRGYTNIGLGHWDEAIADLRMSLSLNPPDSERQWVMTGLELAGGDPQASAKQCNDASGDVAIGACGRAIGSGQFAGTALANLYIDRCIEWSRKADYDRAIADCDQSIKLNSNSRLAHIHKARALLGKQDFKGAIVEANVAVNLPVPGNDPYGFVVRGDVERALGRGDEAEADYRYVLRQRDAAQYAQRGARDGLATLSAGPVEMTSVGADPATDPVGDYHSCLTGFYGRAAIPACGRAIASGRYTGSIVQMQLLNQRAKAYSEVNDFAEAVADYSAIVAIDPTFGNVWADRGTANYNNKDYDHPIADFTEAMRRNHFDSALDGRGKAYFDKGDYDHALADFNQYVKFVQDNSSTLNTKDLIPGALIDRGNAYVRKGSTELAAADFVAAIKLQANNAEAYAGLGLAFMQGRDNDDAVLAFVKALSLGPKEQTAQLADAGLQEVNDDYKQCRTGSDDGAIAACGRVIAAGKLGSYALANAYSDRGGALVDKMQIDRAIADLNEAIKLNPNLVTAYINRGYANQAKKDNKAAIDDFSKSLELNPRNSAVHAQRGQAYAALGDADHAISDLVTALSLNPNDRNLDAGLRVIDADYNQCQTGKGDAVVTACGRVIASGKFRATPLANAYNNRGGTLMDKGQLDQAMTDLNTAIKINPKLAAAYYNRGYVEAAKNDRNAALDDFSQFIALSPSNPVAYFDRGKVYSSMGDTDHAMADYTKAIELNPKQADALKERGLLYVDKKDYDHAISDFAALIAMRPNEAILHIYQSRAYLGRKDAEKSIAEANEAVHLAPNSALAYAFRGDVYWMLRRDSDAEVDYKKALSIDPDYEAAKAGLRDLAKAAKK